MRHLYVVELQWRTLVWHLCHFSEATLLQPRDKQWLCRFYFRVLSLELFPVKGYLQVSRNRMLVFSFSVFILKLIFPRRVFFVTALSLDWSPFYPIFGCTIVIKISTGNYRYFISILFPAYLPCRRRERMLMCLFDMFYVNYWQCCLWNSRPYLHLIGGVLSLSRNHR